MNTVSFSLARNNLKSVLDEVVNDFTTTIITRRNSEDAVIMSLESYNSIMETMHLLKSPANVKHLEESIEQLESGQTVERDLLDD
ncbi:MAG: type II toxin-antitoxin system prevent-host-death family antitoxin [Spirochaetales bacterium]|nr:type II toxin-antitoxin system prevent-host-death family antitoxin [Spirochaetales bacterium]